MAFVRKTSHWDEATRNMAQRVDTLGVGTTLFVKRETVQVMSDIWEESLYVTYWDTAEGKPAGCFLEMGTEVVVDYTPEVFKSYLAYMAKMKYELVFDNAVADAQAKLAQVAKGKTVKVLGGRTRGAQVGKEYKVFHVMDRVYGQGYRSSTRPIAGLALDEEMHEVVGKNGKTYPSYKNVAWVWAHNLEVVGVAEKLEEQIPGLKQHAKNILDLYVTGMIKEFQQQKQQKAA